MRCLILILLAGLLGGCNTLRDARESKGKGITRTFNATEDRVWKELPRAVNDVDLSIAGMYRDEGYLLAERSTTMFSWGERVAVFVNPRQRTQTDVEVVSLRAVALNVTATDFRKRLLDKLEEALAVPR